MSLPNTHLGAAKIKSLLNNKKNLFFDGIGGVSMNSLAHISHLRGFNVSGYDRTASDITRRLENMGIKIYYEEDESHVYDCDALIYTVAMTADSPEYSYAKLNGIPRISRADYLGYLMTDYKNRIGIAGTHGKSTTTGMIAHILTEAKTDPTVLSGAMLKETGTYDIIGGHDFFAFEACEYMDSFLDFNPTIAVILNIEMDHVDYFKSMEQLLNSYVSFMNLTGEAGYAVINADDENCLKIISSYNGKVVSYKRNSPDAVFYSQNEKRINGFYEFDVCTNGVAAAHIALRIPGEHNISNALAAFASCVSAGLSPEIVAKGISSYDGIGRRMEKICETQKGAVVYSDYAHHPTELKTTIEGADALTNGKITVVFQPHTFSRTFELFDDFVSVLTESPADEIILCDIYPARESNIYGISSSQLAKKISSIGKKCTVAESFADAADKADNASANGDMIIVMGAGDVIKVADHLSKK